MQNKDKSTKIIMILGILLILSIGYIAVDKYKTSQEKQLLTAYQNGYLKGIQESVVSLYQQTNNCQPAVINIGNLSRRIFDAACLKNAQQ